MVAAAYPIFASSLEGKTSIPVRWGHEESSMTYIAGALLTHDATSGELEEAGADPAQVHGVALKAASGVAGTMVPYVPFAKGTLFEISVNATVDATNEWKSYGVVLTSGVWLLDLTETTTVVFRIVEIPANMIGVANPRVIVEPLLAAID